MYHVGLSPFDVAEVGHTMYFGGNISCSRTVSETCKHAERVVAPEQTQAQRSLASVDSLPVACNLGKRQAGVPEMASQGGSPAVTAGGTPCA